MKNNPKKEIKKSPPKSRKKNLLSPGDEMTIKDKLETINIMKKTISQFKAEIKAKQKDIKMGKELIQKEKTHIRTIKNEGVQVYDRQLAKQRKAREKRQTQKDSQWIKDHPKEFAEYSKRPPNNKKD